MFAPLGLNRAGLVGSLPSQLGGGEGRGGDGGSSGDGSRDTAQTLIPSVHGKSGTAKAEKRRNATDGTGWDRTGQHRTGQDRTG